MAARRLHRSKTERKIAGVCGGIAEYFDVDPVLVRLAAIAITLVAPPVGLIGYIVCWIVVAEEFPAGGPAAPPERPETPPSAEGATDAGAGPGADSAQEPAPPAGTATEDAPEAATSPPRAPGGDDTNSGVFLGGFLVLIGLFFLMWNFDLFEWGIFRYWRWRYIWPTAMILFGLWMIARGIGPTGRIRSGT